MPRQPFLQVVRNPTGNYNVASKCLDERPELKGIVASCVTAWPYIEAEMSVLLGLLLGAENAAVRAVFQALRRSSAQREAIAEAAKTASSATHQELINAILNVHKSIEAERNALVHGHFGIATVLPDALIWQTTNDYISLQTEMTLVSGAKWNPERHQRMLGSFWVYRKTDLEKILADIHELGLIWHDLINYLKSPSDQGYSLLCDQPRVAQELANTRRKNNPSTPLP